MPKYDVKVATIETFMGKQKILSSIDEEEARGLFFEELERAFDLLKKPRLRKKRVDRDGLMEVVGQAYDSAINILKVRARVRVKP